MTMSKERSEVRQLLSDALVAVTRCEPSREASLVATKIQEAMLWLSVVQDQPARQGA